MPEERRARFVASYGLSAKDAATLTESRELADYFEELAKATSDGARSAANFVLRDVLRAMKEGRTDLKHLRSREWSLVPLLDALARGRMSSTQASSAFTAALEENVPFAAIVKRPEFQQVSDESAIAKVVDDAMAEDARAVADYRRGKSAALEALFGSVMKRTHGQANPQVVRRTLKEKLG